MMSNRFSMQTKNLISIIGSVHQIVIYKNTFLQNSCIKGVIYIDSEHRNQPVLIL